MFKTDKYFSYAKFTSSSLFKSDESEYSSKPCFKAIISENKPEKK